MMANLFRRGISVVARFGRCLYILIKGEFFISGFTNQELRSYFLRKNFGQITRLLARLRVHGIIKKVGKRYKYYLLSSDASRPLWLSRSVR